MIIVGILEHKAYIQRVVPKERLLIMSVKDGWAPLCKFLDKPVPEEPYPHANEAAAIAKILPQMMKETAMVWAAIFAATGVGVYAGMQWWASR